MHVAKLFLRDTVSSVKEDISNLLTPYQRWRTTWPRVYHLLLTLAVRAPVVGVCYVVVFLYRSGPASCIALASWRIVQRDYGGSGADLKPAALNVFYVMVFCQGMLYSLWYLSESELQRKLCLVARKMPSTTWSRRFLVDYRHDLQERCWRDPASIHGRTPSHYAAELLGSGSWEDSVLGARVLVSFIRKKQDLRPLLLPSRPLVQKLVDALGWTSHGAREMRELAARIVAHLAGDIHLAQLPGAVRCISSLLLLLPEETAGRAYQRQSGTGFLLSHQPPPKTQEMIRRLGKAQLKHGDCWPEEAYSSSAGDGGGSGELILQGLAILNGLATDSQNCRDMCSTPGLLPKLTAPLYSATLMDDIGKIHVWDEVVKGSLKALHQLLIHAPAKTSRRLRREISSDERAMSNLKGILDAAGQDLLRIQAMKMMTELALDVSINLSENTKETLIGKLRQIFIPDHDGRRQTDQAPGAVTLTAGKMLVLLSTNSKTNSDCIRTASDDIIPHLTALLGLDARYYIVRTKTIADANNHVICAKIAVELLENLCTHSRDQLSEHFLKETLLPKVLSQIPTSKRKHRGNVNSNEQKCLWNQMCSIFKKKTNDENQRNSAKRNEEANPQNYTLGNDEESQQNSTQPNHEETKDNSTKRDGTENQETAVKELQEALLSLTLAICLMLENQIDYNDAPEMEGLADGAFVKKLKVIVEENCQASADSLRIVKLCGRITESMMQRDHHCIEHFKKDEFHASLSKASESMSSLESCMLFAGTDLSRQKRTVRPLLADLKEKVGRFG